MNLEKQVSSLEPSKRLAELGVKQESYFWWTYAPKEKQEGEWIHVLTPARNNHLNETISAFTAAELGEMLPFDFRCIRRGVDIEDGWSCDVNSGHSWTITQATTEADARAKMLIYLIENGLYEAKK